MQVGNVNGNLDQLQLHVHVGELVFNSPSKDAPKEELTTNYFKERMLLILNKVPNFTTQAIQDTVSGKHGCNHEDHA